MTNNERINKTIEIAGRLVPPIGNYSYPDYMDKIKDAIYIAKAIISEAEKEAVEEQEKYAHAIELYEKDLELRDEIRNDPCNEEGMNDR